MNTKFLFSSLVLALFAILAGGSGDDIGPIFYTFLIVVIAIIIIAFIVSAVEENNKKKRLNLIKEDEANSTDFDRSVNIGDDKCKLYFDAKSEKVMITSISTDNIDRTIIDNFYCLGPGEAVCTQSKYLAFDIENQQILTGWSLKYKLTSFSDMVANSNIEKSNLLAPCVDWYSVYNRNGTKYLTFTAVDESHGIIATSKEGEEPRIFRYIKENLVTSRKSTKKSVTTRIVSNYDFILDDYFKVLVIITPQGHDILNYSSIIDVTYEENGTQLFSKSASRTVGGAVVGGVLMGGAGAIVGGLSGDSKQSKVIKSIKIKLLLRDVNRPTLTLDLMVSNESLNTKNANEKQVYERCVKQANEIKDLISVVIDSAKTSSIPVQQPQQANKQVPSSGVADELAKLAKLKDSGILTDEEFQAQKKKLLGL